VAHTEDIQLNLGPPKAELNSGGTTILLVEDEKFVREVAGDLTYEFFVFDQKNGSASRVQFCFGRP